MTTLYVVTGQTATGKTKRAIELAQKQDGELISADSRQVYRTLDIVTGKDRRELRAAGVTTHLIDVVNPYQEFSSHDFVRHAHPIINDIIARGKTPIIVGGTWLYIKHLLYGHDIQAPPNPTLRHALNKKTVHELQVILADLERNHPPLTNPSLKPLNQSDSQNPHRIIRRIEILTHTAQIQNASPSQNHHTTPNPSMSDLRGRTQVHIEGLLFPTRQALHEAVTARVQKRLEQGAVEEAQKLLTVYDPTVPGLQTIGYTQLISHLRGECTLAQAVDEWVAREMQYAKRQYTFMKQDSSITWHEV